jgi:hypothetical protein
MTNLLPESSMTPVRRRPEAIFDELARRGDERSGTAQNGCGCQSYGKITSGMPPSVIAAISRGDQGNSLIPHHLPRLSGTAAELALPLPLKGSPWWRR